MAKQWIFLDNEWVKRDDKFIELLAPGKLNYLGCFETMRAYHDRIVLLDDHLKRLKRGLKTLNIPFPVSVTKLNQLVGVLLTKNKSSNARVRCLVWKERSARLALTSVPQNPLPQKKYQSGYAVTLVRRSQKEDRALSSVKPLRYRSYLNAYDKARAQGYDEALLLNQNGHIYEGSRSNLFWVKNNQLFTPPLSSGCLAGITRSSILNVCKDLGIKSRQKHLTPAELLTADEAFLTNSWIEVMPIKALNQNNFPQAPGPISLKLSKAYKSSIIKLLKDK